MADPTPKRVSRDVSMSDLESARAALADLAAASSVGYPVLHWAVAVARGASGLPEMWVATNEGASYIPQDVFIPRAMVLAAGHDPAFDARWFGWTNPAETVLRAIQARGDVVSAIATTWPQDSDVVTDATPDVAVGVAPSGNPLEAQASNLTRNRSHRLETVEPALFHDLERGEAAAVSAYLRQVIQQVSFDGGPELSGIAQSIARSLISQRWPSADEWAGLRNEYDGQRLMASSQRPGLIGIEEPGQLLAYQVEYVHCRRLETLMCCEGGSTADIVYAAATAGVLLAFNTVPV
ncbi:chemotaxis protein [Mycobacterium sp. BK086]|uniref:chemotaxis protein n=1 Tax=Mycobacterium sp. BK086 TaxID=2512165 RepID=UPI0025703E9E|nr:chemotaxis protein [Mycobacterium sp. BK086]